MPALFLHHDFVLCFAVPIFLRGAEDLGIWKPGLRSVEDRLGQLVWGEFLFASLRAGDDRQNERDRQHGTKCLFGHRTFRLQL